MIDREMRRSAVMSVEEQKRAIEEANQNSAVARVVRIIYFLFGVLEVVLALRVVLMALGANPDNTFAALVYGLTGPFVALFANLFANPTINGAAVLELTTIVAMIVYAILAWIIGRLIWLVLSRPR
ncbi:MAG: YggT family protein [Anaerolineae bacterium]|nr:YggT family protein [Anaerolineae bacterium]